MFPMLTTAAGTVPPAQVLVIGAGVAGLTAIATARRMGAVVQGYDKRPSAQEDIESLGARFVLLPLQPATPKIATGYAKELGAAFYQRQQELVARVVAGVDVVDHPALIPGKRAPVLIARRRRSSGYRWFRDRGLRRERWELDPSSPTRTTKSSQRTR